MPPAARVTDMHVCPMVTPGVPPIPHVGGPILPPGVPTVLIDFLPAATVTDMAMCVGPPDVIIMGSTSVFINFLPAARLGDPTAHGGVITLGSPTCIIGEVGSPSPGAAGVAAIMAGLAVSGASTPINASASVYGVPGSPRLPNSEEKKASTQSGPPAPVQSGPPALVLNPACVKGAADDKKLVEDTSARVHKLIGDSNAPVESHFWSSSSTKCQARASQMQPVIDRFEKYSAALPSARACLSVNQLADGNGSSASVMPCLKRLPDNAAALSHALGIKPGIITDEDLRYDKTGFRAAIYQSETDGELILVARDTEPNSLVDWKTNTDNGQGAETKQYDQMRTLTNVLVTNDVPFDMAGYSKGGGLAQESGLINTEGKVTVFNSAGIPDTSVGRTATTSMQNLAARTTDFSSEGDFLTFVNQTTDPAKQIENAQWLKDQLAGSWESGYKINLSYFNPETEGTVDPAFADEKKAYLDELQKTIDTAKTNLAAGQSLSLFPPVRASSVNVIPVSPSGLGRLSGISNAAKLYQHQMSIVEPAMEKTVANDRETMANFLAQCQ